MSLIKFCVSFVTLFFVNVSHFLLVYVFIHDCNSPAFIGGDMWMVFLLAISFEAFIYLRRNELSFVFLNAVVIRPWSYPLVKSEYSC